LDYFQIRRAQAYGLTLDQIAGAAALADKTGFPMEYVLNKVEDGYTYPYLAQMWGVPLDQVYNVDRYRRHIDDYLTAYQATGRGALRGMGGGNGAMVTSESAYAAGTGGMGTTMGGGGYISAEATATPVTTGTTTTMGTTGTSTTMGTTTGMATNTSSQTITDVIRSDGRFTQLSSALTAAGLDAYLRGPGPFTLFAPTDAAFAKLPQDQLNSLMQNPAQLSKVIQYHLVGQQIAPGAISGMSSPSLTTIEGDPIQVTSTSGNIMVNGANVTQSGIQASNGTIYAIDTVLMPPSMGTTGTSSTDTTNGAAAAGSGNTGAANGNGAAAPAAQTPSANNPDQASGANMPSGSANTNSGTQSNPGSAGGNGTSAQGTDANGTANPTP
jgi:uncharacterized surface protein with fasciclin (FAS1) repeats